MGVCAGALPPEGRGALGGYRSPSGAGPCPPVRVAPRVAAAVASLFPCPWLAAELSLRNVGRFRVRGSSLVPRDSRTMRSVARREPRDIRQRLHRAEPKRKTAKTHASGWGRSWSPYDCGSAISAESRVCAIPLRHSCGDSRPLRPCSKTDTNPLQPLAGFPLGSALCGRLCRCHLATSRLPCGFQVHSAENRLCPIKRGHVRRFSHHGVLPTFDVGNTRPAKNMY